jgi:hypothetical protein
MVAKSVHAYVATSSAELPSRAGLGLEPSHDHDARRACANETMPGTYPSSQELGGGRRHLMARSIVAQLMQRCREARSQLRRSRREGKSSFVVGWLEAKTEEAWDAAHLAKAMLHGTGPWEALPLQVAQRQSLMDRAELFALRSLHISGGVVRPALLSSEGRTGANGQGTTAEWFEIEPVPPSLMQGVQGAAPAN